MWIPQARWILGCVMAVACLLLLWSVQDSQEGSGTQDRVRRTLQDMLTKFLKMNSDTPHSDNMWYQYMSMMANSTNKSSCYVCSVMPRSSQQPTLHGKPMTKNDTLCFVWIHAFGWDPQSPPYWWKISQMVSGRILQLPPAQLPCQNTTQSFPLKAYNTSGYPTPHKIIMSPGVIHPICFRQSNRGLSLGHVKLCEEIQETTAQEDNVAQWLNADVDRRFVAEGGWWLCGTLAYPTLPSDWSGTCAPIYVSDHTVFLSLTHLQEHHNRQRRSTPVPTFAPHDSVWGSDVPDEYKHWSHGQKVLHCLFPWVGVGKNILRIETMDYRMKMFVNLTIDIFKGQNKQLSALRLMVLQNQMVLDLLAAEKGGVCHMIGTSCCTYIPGENETHINEAMQGLKNLQKARSQDGVPSEDHDPFWWLFGGSWKQILLKIGLVLVAVLLLFCIFMTCLNPLLKSMMTKRLTSAFIVQYQMLRGENLPESEAI